MYLWCCDDAFCLQASASCDGSVMVWNITEQVCQSSTLRVRHVSSSNACLSSQTQVVSWPLLQKTNDVSNAKSLCRLAFQPAAAKVSDSVCVRSPPRVSFYYPINA